VLLQPQDHCGPDVAADDGAELPAFATAHARPLDLGYARAGSTAPSTLRFTDSRFPIVLRRSRSGECTA